MLESLRVVFVASGVETYIFVPPLVAFVISFFTSMAGVSGAFLIMPFQMSVLGFTSPSVSSTNFLYNIVGTPGGILRYIREQRMVWPLAACITIGTLPGVLLGYYFRVKFFPDPKIFKLFVGVVLLYIGFRLFRNIAQKKATSSSLAAPVSFSVSNATWNVRRMEFDFNGSRVSFSIPALAALTFVVGIVGGVYGIGGGAIIAPFCVSILNIPIYTVAGPALFGTFATSLAGVFFYSTIPINGSQTAPPDWPLGILFGIGGLLGMYFGAKCQRCVPEHLIKLILGSVMMLVAGRYIVQFF